MFLRNMLKTQLNNQSYSKTGVIIWGIGLGTFDCGYHCKEVNGKEMLVFDNTKLELVARSKCNEII